MAEPRPARQPQASHHQPTRVLGLEKQGYDFVIASAPNVNRLTIGVLALVAEQERRDISIRTKAALAKAKARGVKLGRPEPVTAGRGISVGQRSEGAEG